MNSAHSSFIGLIQIPLQTLLQPQRNVLVHACCWSGLLFVVSWSRKRASKVSLSSFMKQLLLELTRFYLVSLRDLTTLATILLHLITQELHTLLTFG